MAETERDIRIRTIFETLGGTRLVKEMNKMRLGITDFTSVQKRLGRSIAPNQAILKKTATEVSGYGDNLKKQAARSAILAQRTKSLQGLSVRTGISMGDLREKFKGVATGSTEFGRKIKDVTVSSNKFKKEQEKMAAVAEKQRGLKVWAKQHRTLSDVMGMSLPEFRKFDDGTGRINKGMSKQMTTMGRMGLGLRHLTHGFRGFRMEMLGVMFFGMGVQRFFMGLLKPALQLAGVFELLNVILGILFLPIIMELLPLLMKFLKWVTDLTPAQKKWIGKLVILGLVLGGLLFLIGMFVLGIGSILIALYLLGTVPAVGAGIAAGISAASGVFMTFLGVIGLVAAAIAIAVLLWKSDIGGFRDFVKETFGIIGLTIKQVMDHVVEGVALAFDTISAILEGDWMKVDVNLDKLWRIFKAVFWKIAIMIGAVLFNLGAFLFNFVSDFIADVIIPLILRSLGDLLDRIGDSLQLLPGFELLMRVGAANLRKAAADAPNRPRFRIDVITMEEIADGFKRVDEKFGLVAEKADETAKSLGFVGDIATDVSGSLDEHGGEINKFKQQLMGLTGGVDEFNETTNEEITEAKLMQEQFKRLTARMGELDLQSGSLQQKFETLGTKTGEFDFKNEKIKSLVEEYQLQGKDMVGELKEQTGLLENISDNILMIGGVEIKGATRTGGGGWLLPPGTQRQLYPQ